MFVDMISEFSDPEKNDSPPTHAHQIPKEWQEKRKSLLPHFKEAKKQGKRARFIGPKLLMDGHFVTTGVPSHQA